MKIRIKDNPSGYIRDLAGKVVDVQTEHLFNDQFNTAEFRVMQADVAEIIDDIRVNLRKCGYCGFSHITVDMATCPKCINNDHEYGLNAYVMADEYYTTLPKGLKVSLTTSRSSRDRYYLIKDNSGMGGGGAPVNHYSRLFVVVNGVDRGNGYQGYSSIDYMLSDKSELPEHAKRKIKRLLKI